ncbi:hypothetical protein RND81_09G006100 [Saponaria officinalis]|uniref:TFIIS central domain-containing protein n=1 Tax=Saponaria officinalis TaxID=3572 RepID=A0AAW1IH60_SAPOF
MNPVVSTCETTMPNVHRRSTELLDGDPTGLELPTTIMNSGLTTSSFSMLMSPEMLSPFKQKGELDQPKFLYAGLEEENLSLLNKRKATAEYNLPNMSVSNKKAAASGPSPKSLGVPQLSTQYRRSEVQSRSPRTSVSSKKTVQIEPVVSKSQSVVARKRKQSETSSDAGKIDPVRAKLRESLTEALALVSKQKASSDDSADKTEDMVEVATQKEESKPVTSMSGTAICNNIETAAEGCGSSAACPTEKVGDDKGGSQEVHLNRESWKFLGHDFQSSPIFPGEDAPFGESLFLRDELLQGNGLSWALDFDAQIAEMHAVESTQRDELAREADAQETEQVDMSPESVALRIESELFTLFGGVNKKYKEKGRSLLFNLKDRNNPELRERVMSGEIPPERLCSMTAEELASKELSQWRMAKAEELDQMKVLPDSEVNVRRLVKKTHKGEYQVDFDQDVSVVEDIPANLSVVHENGRRKTSDGGGARARARNLNSSDGAKEHADDQCTITIPGDGTDMLGLMVDDMRDLPPILSLDEFMESLDKEPPFENLPVDSEKSPEPDTHISEDGTESKSPVPPSETLVVPTSVNDKEDEGESVRYEGRVNSAENQRASEAKIKAEQIKVESLWEGLLQLTISSTAYVLAIYKSGEKTSTRDWPSSFEIKGRVRLDAFDKFLQELPKSRTRATMVVHFALAKHCTEEERCNLTDLIDSYVTDQRLGYAEPAPGVELYLCPPRSKTVDMIVNHLPKGYTEKLNDVDNGLVGILVWRKEQMPSVTLPNPSTQHKHTNPEKIVNKNVNMASRPVHPPTTFSKPAPKSDEDVDDDDLPPGFGPGGADREEDDLPEFNFSGGSNLPSFPTTKPHNPPPVVPPRPEVPPRQLEQMRALIQKYGKSGDNSVNGIPVQPWNDDDDDDMPEWQPHTVLSRQPPTPSGFPAQTLTPHLPSHPSFQQPIHPLANSMPVARPNMATHRHPGPNTVHPTGSPGRRGQQPTGAQFYRGRVGGRRNREWRSPNAFGRSSRGA